MRGMSLRRRLVSRERCSCHPIFIAPNVTEQHEHETSQVENKFLDWNRSTDGRDFASKCGRFVWENEESVAKEQIEQEAERCEQGDAFSKMPFSETCRSGSAGKPPRQRTNRN